MKPLCIDLFAGLGGWSKGFLAEGWDCIGFDVERHQHGDARYPAQLVLQDVLTMHGSQFRNADCIVASPPCQEFSYMAMPWKRGKAIAQALRGQGAFPEGYTGSRTVSELAALFDTCFRIQREASEAAGRHIPMVVENVKGAQPWVGRANANFGSFYLWGDVRNIGGRIVAAHQVRFGVLAVKSYRGTLKQPGRNFHFPEKYGIPSPSFHGAEHEESVKSALAIKNDGGSWFAVAHNTESGHSRNPVHEAQKQPVWFNDDKRRATKCGGDWFGPGDNCSLMRSMSSRSDSRKAASAMIAEIPFELSSYIARSFRPQKESIA